MMGLADLFEYRKSFDLNEIYLYRCPLDHVRAVNVYYDKGCVWSDETMPTKMTSVPCIKWEEIKKIVISYQDIKGVLNIVSPSKKFEFNSFGHCTWFQGQQLITGWRQLNQLEII